MDFPLADSGKVTELGILLADEFSDSLSRQADGVAVVNRSQILSILRDEEIPRESLQDKEISLYVAKKAGADETLTGFLTKGSDGNLILSVRVFGPKRVETLDTTLATTDAMRELLAKEIRSPEPRADAIEPEPGVLVAGKDGVSNPSCIYCPIPQYSDRARMAKYSGTTKLSVIVTLDGQPTAIKVIQGAPFGLTKQAILEVQKWRFKPAEKDGKPVAARVPVEVTFRCSRKQRLKRLPLWPGQDKGELHIRSVLAVQLRSIQKKRNAPK
jgi:TonB family protein